MSGAAGTFCRAMPRWGAVVGCRGGKPMDTGPMARRARGLRRDSVISAVIVVGLALIAGGALLLVLLQSALINTTKVALQERGRDVALLIQQGGPDTNLQLAADLEHGERIQLLTGNGTVLQSSDSRLTAPMSPRLLPPPGQTRTERLDQLPSLRSGEDVLVAAYGTSVGGKTLVVQVARPIQIQADTIRTVAWFLLGGGPLLLCVVALAVWALVGRSLRTVDRITTQVGRIGGTNLDERSRCRGPPTRSSGWPGR